MDSENVSIRSVQREMDKIQFENKSLIELQNLLHVSNYSINSQLFNELPDEIKEHLSFILNYLK